jgi:biopolymer transport protein ExbB/biopolymer transport protein TolQ
MPPSLYSSPVIAAVRRASSRSTVNVHQQMQRGLGSLRTVACVAPLMGLFGTVLGMLNSLRSSGTSRSTMVGVIAGCLSEAMVPTLLGLCVALAAFWFHQYLSSQMEVFDIEMENSSVDLVNRLIVQLGRLPKLIARLPPQPIQRTSGEFEVEALLV